MLLGIVLPNDQIAFCSPPPVIDQQFVDTAREGRPPETRFRFSAPCLKTACAQWSGGRCGVVERLLPRGEQGAPADDPLRACDIRPQCRWYRQRGSAACAICVDVVTMVSAPEVGPAWEPVCRATALLSQADE